MDKFIYVPQLGLSFHTDFCFMFLSELHFADCRLLETWSDQEEGLRQLVAALKSVPSLHTLALPQNRLGRSPDPHHTVLWVMLGVTLLLCSDELPVSVLL